MGIQRKAVGQAMRALSINNPRADIDGQYAIVSG